MIDNKSNLTNARIMLADETPIHQNRLFCTRWDGLNKVDGLSKIVEGYKSEENYTNDKKPTFYFNRTQFKVILLSLNYRVDTNEPNPGIYLTKKDVRVYNIIKKMLMSHKTTII